MTRVLVVDDETAIADALQDILSMEGYEVVTALNGHEGLRLLNELKPDLVLLDLMMPVMDGRELLRRVQADPQLRGIPVVVMSAGRITEEERRTARAILAKPFALDALLRTVAQLAGQPGTQST
jgi:CheY-like chemotaxis protein